MLLMAKEARRIQRFYQEALQGWLAIMSLSPGMSPSKRKVSAKRAKNNDAAVEIETLHACEFENSEYSIYILQGS